MFFALLTRNLWFGRALAPVCLHPKQYGGIILEDAYCFLHEKEKLSQPPCKSFSYRLVSCFHFPRCGNAMFAFQASLVHFTLIELSRRALLSKSIPLLEKFCGTQNFLLLEFLQFKRFCMSLFSLWVQSETYLNYPYICELISHHVAAQCFFPKLSLFVSQICYQ